MVLAGDGCHEAMRPAWTAIEGPASKRRRRSSQGCVLSVSIWHPVTPARSIPDWESVCCESRRPETSRQAAERRPAVITGDSMT
jgi:hypothetical protein